MNKLTVGKYQLAGFANCIMTIANSDFKFILLLFNSGNNQYYILK